MGMINKEKKFEEGEVFVRWVNNRIEMNKNVLAVTTGPTGSGKSLCDLRKAELIHLKRFNEPFPIENCCFSIGELIKRINNGNLRKGEVLILEESGVNLGSGDWQHKLVKMFNYILQSFRSMNIVLMMNLPVFSMLAKQARQLVHINMETQGINFENKMVRVKPLFHQLNQHSGKSYWKFIRVRTEGKVRAIKRMSFGLPSPEIVQSYNQKKTKFLTNLTNLFEAELDKDYEAEQKKMMRKGLPLVQLQVYNMLKEGLTPKEIAERRGTTDRMIHKHIELIELKGYPLDFYKRNMRKELATPII